MAHIVSWCVTVKWSGPMPTNDVQLYLNSKCRKVPLHPFLYCAHMRPSKAAWTFIQGQAPMFLTI